MKKRLLPPLILAVASVIGGGIWFANVEQLPAVTGLYWALTTAATVGYGDITPHGQHGRLVASLVMVIAIPSLGAVFGILTGGHVVKRMAVHHEAMREDAAAARRIAADLHEKLTGDRHPDAPEQDAPASRQADTRARTSHLMTKGPDEHPRQRVR